MRQNLPFELAVAVGLVFVVEPVEGASSGEDELAFALLSVLPVTDVHHAVVTDEQFLLDRNRAVLTDACLLSNLDGEVESALERDSLPARRQSLSQLLQPHY